MDPITLLISILTLSLFTILIKLQTKPKPNSPNQPPPPGPWKLPIIGHIHHLAGGAGKTLPHRRLRDLSKIHGPVMLLQLGEISHVVISSPEAAKQVFKTHDAVFSQRPFNLAAKIITYDRSDLAHAAYGDFWRHIRKLCTTELLSSKRVGSFRPIREEEGMNFVRRIAASGSTPVNLSRMVFLLTYGVTSRIAFGKRCKVEEDDDQYVAVVEEIMAAAVGFGVADLFPSVKWLQRISGMKGKLKRLHGVQDKLLESIIAEHRARRKTGEGENRGIEEEDEVETEDLVDALLNLQRDNGDDHQLGFSLTNDNIKAVIGDVFIAGSETSSTTVEWAISELIKNPDVMRKAQTEVRRVFGEKGRVDEAGLHELSYLKLVIKETLRLHTPAPLLVPRESREECEVGGYLIPTKATVMVNSWAIARDPKTWDEPETFWPERFLDGAIDYKGTNFEYLPFGAGRRMCPGIGFGIANTELPLANLLFYFDWKLPGDLKMESLDMEESFGVTVKRKHDLEVVPLVRYPPPAI
ncbi:Cytochrome P450 71D11 (Fragment) [Linum grandiflorum]